MADYLASAHGTEKDKSNCHFYYKIGACRHGGRCSRAHVTPTRSNVVLVRNFWINPALAADNGTESAAALDQNGDANGNHKRNGRPSESEVQKSFEDFYEDTFVELNDKYGRLMELQVCDNLGDHLIGNVYAMFEREEDALACRDDLNDRWFDGRPMYAELSPLSDFRDAVCRKHDIGDCERLGFCNFMHLRHIGEELEQYLYSSVGGQMPSGLAERAREAQANPHRAGAQIRASHDRDYNTYDDQVHHRDRDRDHHRSSHRRESERDRYGDQERMDRDYRDRDRDRDHRDRRDRDRDRDHYRSSRRESRDYRDRDRDRDRDYHRRDSYHSRRDSSYRHADRDKDRSDRDRDRRDRDRDRRRREGDRHRSDRGERDRSDRDRYHRDRDRERDRSERDHSDRDRRM
eukprot:Clim_evm6s159 gene=Clim_evmTU6s159